MTTTWKYCQEPTIALMVSASKSRTVSNSFFASIRQLFKLECLLWSECWDTNLDIKSIDYSWWSTHWLELTKSRVAATNVEEALLYLIFNKTLSRKSGVEMDKNEAWRINRKLITWNETENRHKYHSKESEGSDPGENLLPPVCGHHVLYRWEEKIHV